MENLVNIRLDTFPWKLSQEQFNYYTPEADGRIGVYQFHVNSNITTCDFWIVRGSIQRSLALVKCPRENIIFITDESYDEAEFPALFLRQFEEAIGPIKIMHKNYLKHHEMFPWLFNRISYFDLYADSAIPKTKELCIIASDSTWLKGHKDRFAFVNKLLGHFKDRIDIYGRGFNDFDCKYEILKNYKYSICIENCSKDDYFTEKINECYLAETMPLYYGCKNISDYYDSSSFILIDIFDFNETVKAIERALETNAWEKNILMIRRMKLLYFEKYHFPQGLVQLLNVRNVDKCSWNLIFHKSFFVDLNFNFGIIIKDFVVKISSYFVKAFVLLRL